MYYELLESTSKYLPCLSIIIDVTLRECFSFKWKGDLVIVYTQYKTVMKPTLLFHDLFYPNENKITNRMKRVVKKDIESYFLTVQKKLNIIF